MRGKKARQLRGMAEALFAIAPPKDIEPFEIFREGYKTFDIDGKKVGLKTFSVRHTVEELKMVDGSIHLKPLTEKGMYRKLKNDLLFRKQVKDFLDAFINSSYTVGVQ